MVLTRIKEILTGTGSRDPKVVQAKNDETTGQSQVESPGNECKWCDRIGGGLIMSLCLYGLYGACEEYYDSKRPKPPPKHEVPQVFEVRTPQLFSPRVKLGLNFVSYAALFAFGGYIAGNKKNPEVEKFMKWLFNF